MELLKEELPFIVGDFNEILVFGVCAGFAITTLLTLSVYGITKVFHLVNIKYR